MAACPQTQVDALAQLLSLKQDVNKDLHLKCVVNALSSVELDTETALKVSAIIEQQSAFSLEEKQRLQKCLTEQVNVGGAKKRRAYQDFTALASFLTDEVWDALSSYPYTRAADILMTHAFRLGLGTPSEPTYASLTALLCIFQPAKTGFGLAQTYETTKSTWQSFKKKRMNRIQAGDLHLLELPAPDELPDALKIAAFGQQPRVECRIKDSSLQDLEDRIIMRKSNSLSPKNQAAQLAGSGAAMSEQLVARDAANSGGPLLNQLIQVLMLLAKQRFEEQEVPLQMLRRSSSDLSSVMSSASASKPKALPSPPCETHVGNTLPSMLTSVDPGLEMLSAVPEKKLPETPQPAAVASDLASEKQQQEVPQAEKVADAVTQAQQMVADLEERPKLTKNFEPSASPKTLKRPAAAGMPSMEKKTQVAKTQEVSSSSTDNKGWKRPSSAHVKTKPKPAEKKTSLVKKQQGKTVKKELKMDRKNVHSRAWHSVRKKVYQQTGDDDLACRKATAAAQKAVKALDKASSK